MSIGCEGGWHQVRRQAGGERQGHGQLLHHGQVLLLQQLQLPLLQLLDGFHLLEFLALSLLFKLLLLLLLVLPLLEGMDKLGVGVKRLQNSGNSPKEQVYLIFVKFGAPSHYLGL